MIHCQTVILQGGRCFCICSVHCVEDLGGKVLNLYIVRWKQNWNLECLSSWGCRREKLKRSFLQSNDLNWGIKLWTGSNKWITWYPFFSRLAHQAAIPFLQIRSPVGLLAAESTLLSEAHIGQCMSRYSFYADLYNEILLWSQSSYTCGPDHGN